jgi:hypothetical protein
VAAIGIDGDLGSLAGLLRHHGNSPCGGTAGIYEPAVTERLRKMGIEPVAFETCASTPASVDYLSATIQTRV